MAKKVWDKPIDKNIPWDGNQNTDNLPVCGYRIEEFIKSQLDSRIGILYYDITNNRYLAFSDTIDRDEYLDDPTKVDLILATFDAPFNYSAEITLQTPSYNAVFLNSTGNYIDFTFDIVNKQGASTGENVIISYTFIRNANKQVVTETRKFGDVVHFNIDKYLDEGTNTIIIGITGQTTLAATTTAITYQVVNLTLSDDLNIARYYNISEGPQQVEIPFTVSGYGTKIVEWYIDGELLDFIKTEDEVVDVITTRTKYITLSNLNQGSHSLQIRAYSVINGERFYTDTLYRDLLVYTGNGNNIIIGIATTIPREYGIIGANDRVAIYEMVQYVPYTIRFATYSPLNAAATEIIVMLDAETVGSTISRNDIENEFVITSKTSGNRVLALIGDTGTKGITVSVGKTSMNIDEIEGAIIDFTASGKNNESVDRDTWTNGVYTGTLTGFNWNNTSGWVNGRLEMNAGSSLAINYAPLNNNPTTTGKTIEIEWSTRNVTNDNAVICDLRGPNGVGILITATKVSMVSADGVIVETEYKSDENVRIGFVINRSEGTTNRRLSFIYTNGIVSRAEQWAATDNYNSSKEIVFTATDEAEISLKSIRVYDTALSSDNMLNNFILYRDTISEMMEVYDRNDVYEEGTTTFSPDKMRNRLPVMIVTGDIPILENTSDKDEQIVVDIEYYNTQDPSKSFTMKNAAMRPQGTSSMGYPKKNFRIYTQKVANTELYDSNGILVENKLYSFRDKAQPVNCWCLKADYAESSGTHNTGIAKLWNDALYNAQIDGEYKFRTEAQKKAIENKYDYDVRTTIDGFPILLFYRPKANEDLIFIGKYNFNNDKSTEKVFGFTDIPGFDNSRMQCWEVLNNGNSLALFTSTEGFDDNWSEAFESRYPDTKTPYTGDLKAFCEWMTNVSREDFATQKWEHLDVYKMAAYWIYLMRHAAADQFVKNAMFTSEDGIHFYYILYDNDTINGLINSGYLRIKPTDGRQTVDDTGSYVFAGHDSRLWNLLEADEEFMNILSSVDNALYTAGISYDNTIRIFDKEQADKWVEKVYNQDAQYKYIGPYVEKGINNLFMLQGKRDLHRKWWLAKRFSIFDAKYVSGSYKSQAIEIKCLNGTEVGQKFTIKAGYPLDYGYGINNIPRSFGITLDIGETHEFTTQEVINIGDPLRIYGAPNISELDLSKMSDRLAVVTITNVFADNLGTKLTKLVLGNPNKINYEISEISGLKQAVSLEYLDIQGMTKMSSLDLSNHPYFKTLKAKGSGISSISFAKGAPVEMLELPSSIRVLSLNQLPYLDNDNIIFENISSLQQLNVSSCPNITNDFDFVYNWIINKTASNENCSLTMDGVDWSGVSGQEFYQIASLGTVSLKGKVVLTDITEAQGILFERVFGSNVFDENAEFYIDAPTTITMSGPTSILEGDSATYIASVYPRVEGTTRFSLPTTRTGCSINTTTGVLTTNENGLATSNIVVRVTFIPSNGEPAVIKDYTVSVVKRTYPANATINGNSNPILEGNYGWSTTTSSVNGSMTATWTLSGDIVDYVEISSSNLNSCSINMTYPPLGVASGTLTLTLKKAYNGATILTITKVLSAELEGVIITGRSNAPVQAALYAAGAVANEKYSLQSELEKITDISTVFKSKGITTFDEFQYFTAVTSIPNSAFSGNATMTNLTIPSRVSSIHEYPFGDSTTPQKLNITVVSNNNYYSSVDGVLFNKTKNTLVGFFKGDIISDYTIPSSVHTVENGAFCKSNVSVVRCSNALTLKDSFYSCKKLTKLDFEILNVDSINGLVLCTALTEVTFADGFTSISSNCFTGCKALNKITSNSIVAPKLQSGFWGSSSGGYAGQTNASKGTNRLIIPLNATGYETGQWLNPLQSTLCGFTIHGKITIASNKSNATFNIAYISEGNVNKTITVGAGTFYINDVKYGASMTITPNALSGYTWEKASETITYNGVTTVTLNAYIYPTSVTISGDSAIKGGNNATYTASVSPSNVDIGVTYSWSLSNSANASISSSSGNQCTITTQSVETEESLTLTCVATTTDGKKVQKTFTITLQTRPNFITATYTGSGTKKLLYASYSTSNIEYMEVDGVQVTPAVTYDFSSSGTHRVRYTLKTLQFAFRDSSVVQLDFSECNGAKYDSTYYMARDCKSLTNVIWGECRLTNVSTARDMYSNCVSLTEITTSPFSGGKLNDSYCLDSFCSYCSALKKADMSYLPDITITSISQVFYQCTRLEQIIWGNVKFPNVTSLSNMFYGCGSLTEIDLSPFDSAPITYMYGLLCNCEKITTVDLTPLRNARISKTSSIGALLAGCTSLKEIIAPWQTAPTVNSNTFGSSSSVYTGRKTYSTGQNILYVPAGATGYDTSYWLDPLQNASKCGFTLSATL